MSAPRANMLDGAATAAAIKEELRARVERLARVGVVPGLGTLLVGDDDASRSYVRIKHDDCAEIGIESVAVELPASVSQREIEDAVGRLNDDPAVSGFIVQLPLPGGIDEQAVLERVNPAKDADGLHPVNLGRLVLGLDPTATAGSALPCTPLGVLELLERHGVGLAGKLVVVIGRGATVGRPLGLLLTRRGVDATVVLAHSHTEHLAAEVRRADVVIASVGQPHLVQPDWIKPGAAVVDVGVTQVGSTESGKSKLAGDVDPAVADVAQWLSSTPGGVGPMTRVMLLANVVAAAERAAGAAATDATVRRVGDDLADDAASADRPRRPRITALDE